MGILALSALERLEAARKLSSSSSLLSVVLVVIVVLIGIAVLYGLAMVSFRFFKKRRQSQIDSAFYRKARSAGLSNSETDILLQIASGAGLEKKESIFEISSVFDRGVLSVLAETTAFDGFAAGKILKEKLAAIREKLNFKNHAPNLSITLNSVNTGHIPLGQKVTVIQPGASKAINSKIVGSEKNSITLKLTEPLNYGPGAAVYMQGCFEDIAAFEFETSVISSNGILLTAQYQDRLRFSMI